MGCRLILTATHPGHSPAPPPAPPDAASKHATQAFFDCLRAEVEQDQIAVTVVSPGYIHTNLSLNAVTANGSRYGGEARPSCICRGTRCLDREGGLSPLTLLEAPDSSCSRVPG